MILVLLCSLLNSVPPTHTQVREQARQLLLNRLAVMIAALNSLLLLLLLLLLFLLCQSNEMLMLVVLPCLLLR